MTHTGTVSGSTGARETMPYPTDEQSFNTRGGMECPFCHVSDGWTHHDCRLLAAARNAGRGDADHGEMPYASADFVCRLCGRPANRMGTTGLAIFTNPEYGGATAVAHYGGDCQIDMNDRGWQESSARPMLGNERVTATAVEPEPIVNYGKFSFTEASRAITDVKAIRRWVNWVRTQVRIGMELEKAGNVEFADLEDAYHPTHSFERLSDYNVVEIHEDGSVSGSGAEILVVGSTEDFYTLYQKLVRVHGVLADHGLHVDVSCGMHYHMIAAQNDILPAVIMKNFYQLFRRYFAGLLYLTATTGTNREGIARSGGMDYFRPAHMNVSPIGRSMAQVKALINRDCGRYAAFNMGGDHRDLIRFNAAGDVTEFHIELRFPDASDAPSQIAAQAYLFRAMLIKAVELSKFGVLIWPDDEIRRVKTLAAEIASYPMTEANKVAARADALDLLGILKPVLKNIDGACIGILDAMCELPVWARRKNGNRWTTVEHDLMPAERVLDEVADKVLRAIQTQELVGMKNIRHWETAMAERLGIPTTTLISAIRRVREDLRLDFDREIGSYVVQW